MSSIPKVIEETPELLVIDKPAGLIVHSDGRTEEPSVADWLLKEYPQLRGVGETWVSPQGETVELPGIVHRLDRSTSGIMLIAKTQQMFEYLRGEFKARRVQKIYRAFVYGHMEKESGTIVAEIMRSSTPPKRWYARPCDASDKRAAVTDWKLLKKIIDKDVPISYIEVQPRTGRTHQIRVHLASIGHPIVSDYLYAADRPQLLGFTRPALHAYRITINFDGKPTTFEAPLTDAFQLNS